MASKPFYCWFRASALIAFLASVKWRDDNDDDTDASAFNVALMLISFSFHNYLSLSWLFIQHWIMPAYLVLHNLHHLNCGTNRLKCRPSYRSKYFLVLQPQMMMIEILLFHLNHDVRAVWDSIYTAGVAQSKINNKPYPRYINVENFQGLYSSPVFPVMPVFFPFCPFRKVCKDMQNMMSIILLLFIGIWIVGVTAEPCTLQGNLLLFYLLYLVIFSKNLYIFLMQFLFQITN